MLGVLMVGRLGSVKRWSSSRLTCKRGANLNWPGLRLFVVASIADSGGLQQAIAQVLELRTLWCLALDKQTIATKDLSWGETFGTDGMEVVTRTPMST